MYQALLVVYLLVAISIIFLVLMQQGKGADMGGSFSMGASATLFGSTGSNQFMRRMTTVLAILFFALSLLLGNLGNTRIANSQWQDLSEPVPLELEPEVAPLTHQKGGNTPD